MHGSTGDWPWWHGDRVQGMERRLCHHLAWGMSTLAKLKVYTSRPSTCGQVAGPQIATLTCEMCQLSLAWRGECPGEG